MSITEPKGSTYGKQYTRYRERDERLLIGGVDQAVHVHNGVPISDVTTNLSQRRAFGYYRDMTDVVTPGFKARMKQGELINTANIWRKIFRNPSPSIYGYVSTAAGHACTSIRTGYAGLDLDQAGAPPVDVTAGYPISSQLNQSKAIALATINANKAVLPPDVDSLLVAAELTKSISLLTTSATTIAKVGEAIGQGKPHSAIQGLFGRSVQRAPVSGSVSGVARRWLEYRYGWGPLLLDLHGALQASARGYEVLSRRRTARGFGNESWAGMSDYATSITPVHSSLGSYTLRYRLDDEVKVRAYILYEADLAYQRLRHFGLDRVISTGWELIPYSFVVDWFIPIGDWVSAIEPKLGVNVLATGYTWQRKQTRSRVVTAYNPSADAHVWVESPSLIGHVDSCVDESGGRVVPLGYPSFPPIDVKINVKRAIDAVALLKGVASRHF